MDDRTPWWARPRARLGVLLVILAGVAAYGLPRIVRNVSGRGPEVAACPPAVAPTTRLGLSDMRRLWPLIGNGYVQWAGRQHPDSAWIDGVEVSPRDRKAGYRLIWWSRSDDHLSASVFAFRSAADAAAYVDAAGSTRCRGPAIAYAVGRPVAGRAVVFTNQYLALEADVFFARGRQVFRVSDVPRHSRGRVPGDVDVRSYAQAAERVALALIGRGKV